MHKVVVSKLFEGSLLVDKHTSVSVGAVESFVELIAQLGLVFGALRLFFNCEVLPSMCKLAFGSVSAIVLLHPVFAHLCLVLSPVHLDKGSCLDRGFPEVAVARTLRKIIVGGFGDKLAVEWDANCLGRNRLPLSCTGDLGLWLNGISGSVRMVR